MVLSVALLAGGFARVEVKLQPLCAINMVWKYPFFFFFSFLKGKASAQCVQQAWHAACAAACRHREVRPLPETLPWAWSTSGSKPFGSAAISLFLFALYPPLLPLGTAPGEMRLALVVCCCVLGCSRALLGELRSLCCSLSVCLAGMLWNHFTAQVPFKCSNGLV